MCLRVVGIEQIHDLVGATALVERVELDRQRRRRRARITAYAGDGLHEGLEDHHEPTPSGVDDPGPAQDLELVGGALECISRRVRGRCDQSVEAGARAERGHRLRCRPGDREHGALPRVGDGGVRRIRCRREGPHQTLARIRHRGLDRGEAVGEAPHQLAQDDSGIPSRPQQCAVGERGDAVAHASRGLLRKCSDRRLEREEHVGAGVAIGHGEHVELVDLASVPSERLEPEVGPAADPGGVEAV